MKAVRSALLALAWLFCTLPAGAAGTLPLTGAGMAAPGGSAPAPTFFTAAWLTACNPVLIFGPAKLVAGYNGPLINVYNAGSTANQDFGAASGQHVSGAAVLAFQGASYLGMRKEYDQSGAGNDLTETTPGEMLQAFVDTNGRVSAISGRDTTRNQSIWTLDFATSNNATTRKLLVPASAAFNRQNATIYLVARSPSARRWAPWFELGDLSGHADLAYWSPGTQQVDTVFADESGTLKEHDKVDHYKHSIYGLSNLSVHALRTGTTEASIEAHVDDRFVQIVDEGNTWSSRAMTSGGQIGAVGGGSLTTRGGFVSTSAYQLGETVAGVVCAAKLSDTDLEAGRQVLAAVFKTPTTTTKSLMFGPGDSIEEGLGALQNQTLPRLTSDHLSAQDTMVHNWGLSNVLASASTHFFSDADGGVASSSHGAYQVSGGLNAAFVMDGHNDLATHDTVANIEGYLTAILADARSANGGAWGKVGIATIMKGTDICDCGGQLDETHRQAVNAWIVANSAGFDFVADFAGEAHIAAPGAESDTTLLFDGIHPTELLYGYLFPILKTQLQAIGFTLSLNTARPANDNGRYAPAELAA